MKQYAAFLLFIFILSSCATEKSEPAYEPEVVNENGVRYKDLIYNDVQVSRNIEYGSNTTQNGIEEELFLDFYEGQNDTISNRPLIIFAHGGSFTSGDKIEMDEIAQNFAQSGYATASISYRLIDVSVNVENTLKGVIDAIHDMRAAVRFFKSNFNTYGIDSTNIFVAGYSAGAITALHVAYVQSMADIQLIGGSSLTQYVNANGGLDGNSGNLNNTSSIKGALSWAGALPTIDIIDPFEPILFSAHGTDDQTVPYSSGIADNLIEVQGSFIIHEALNALTITNKLFTLDGDDHNILALENCINCSLEARNFVFQNLD